MWAQMLPEQSQCQTTLESSLAAPAAVSLAVPLPARAIWSRVMATMAFHSQQDGTLATNNLVEGNFVGTQAGGTGVLGNRLFGINFSTGANNNTAGGTSAAAHNVVCDNRGGGVNLVGSSNTVQGNWIGIDAAGNAAGNVLRGIDITGSNNLIGGNVTGAGNRIANSITGGVVGVGIRVTTGTGNRISRNSIFSNDSLGIDLRLPTGVNPNDPQDPDVGGNRLQNYPVITSVITTGSSTIIEGTLNSAPKRGIHHRILPQPGGGSLRFRRG